MPLLSIHLPPVVDEEGKFDNGDMERKKNIATMSVLGWDWKYQGTTTRTRSTPYLGQEAHMR